MEFQELSSISTNLDSYIPFGIFRAENANVFCSITRSVAQILELSYQHHNDGNIRCIQTSILCPKSIPSKGITKNFSKIYNKVEQKYKNEILLDPLLVPEVPFQSEITIAFISAKFSGFCAKRNGFYLAGLSNCGGFEIHFKALLERRWNVVCDLSLFWTFHCLSNYETPIEDYATLRKYVSDTQITAMSWNDTSFYDNQYMLCIVNSSGKIAFIRFDCQEYEIKPLVIFEKDTSLLKVNSLEWITFCDKKRRNHSYVVASDHLGNVILFEVALDSSGNVVDLSELSAMWKEGDKVRAVGLKWTYQSQTENLIITCCKGSHVFLYLLDRDGKVLSHCIYYVAGLFISGIHPLSSTEYLVGTLNGNLERISIEIHNKTIHVSAETVKHEINTSKFILYGFVGSVNNAFLISALHIAQPYDHLKFRQTAQLFVQQHLDKRVLEKLEQNETKKLTNFHDYAELFRCLQMKRDIFRDYFARSPSAVEFTEDYLYKLKIRLIATSARSTFLRQRGYFGQADALLSEHEIVKKILYAIRCYRSIQYLSSLKMTLNNFQALSLKCQRNYLRDFLCAELTENYEKLRIEFQPEIEILLTETEPSETDPPENCYYCDAPIADNRLTCAENHCMPRCCLSMVQLPLASKNGCMTCQTTTFDDVEHLKQILPDSTNDLVCPLCDLPFNSVLSGYS